MKSYYRLKLIHNKNMIFIIFRTGSKNTDFANNIYFYNRFLPLQRMMGMDEKDYKCARFFHPK